MGAKQKAFFFFSPMHWFTLVATLCFVVVSPPSLWSLQSLSLSPQSSLSTLAMTSFLFVFGRGHPLFTPQKLPQETHAPRPHFFFLISPLSELCVWSLVQQAHLRDLDNRLLCLLWPTNGASSCETGITSHYRTSRAFSRVSCMGHHPRQRAID